MITDSETNLLFLSDQLIHRTDFYNNLIQILNRNQIRYEILPGTRDIWCRDFMPIQKSLDQFIQFTYKPSYLLNDEFMGTITNVDKVCGAIGIFPMKSEIRIDGGNIIRGKDWVILTDRIFSENKNIPRKKLLAELERLFEAKPIIIPSEPGDYLGHADGIVRFHSEDTLLINSYKPDDNPGFQKQLKEALIKEGFKLIEIPYNPYVNTDLDAADGFYINFLQMEDFILLPIFNKNEDESTFKLFQVLYPSSSIEAIDSRVISQDGGVLNCISWNIYQG